MNTAVFSSGLPAAVEGEERVGPGGVRGGATNGSEAEVPAGLSLGVVVLERRGFFSTGCFHPAQPLQVGEVSDEGVVAATGGLVRDAGQVFGNEKIDVVRVDEAFLFPGLPFLVPGGPVGGGCLDQSRLVVEEDVRLRSTNDRVDRR